ncbi:MAG: RloB family protein [Anaerolineaceae bacterium]
MPEKRKIPPRIRRTPENVRDSSLILIATEGAKTEKKYFESFATKFRNPKINILVFPNIDDQSDPKNVIDSFTKYIEQQKLEENDQKWVVIDRDKWKQESLSDVAARCIQNNILLAVSTPCFEFWLLLHVKRILEYTEEELRFLFDNKKINRNRTYIERELSQILGGYDKTNPRCERFFTGIQLAISQAENLDVHPEQRWPNQLGSRVYRLVRIIGRI